MKWLAIILAAVPLLGQGPNSPTERPVEGSIEMGYRWMSPVGGDFTTYRSIVNLGEGPKLLGFDISIRDPGKHLFDRLDLRGSSWGGDPYNTAHLDAVREHSYRLTFDYRNIAYYNFLPSFDDPLLAAGITLNERGYDTRRRMANVRLDLLPGRWIVPYFAYSHNSGSGTGTTVFYTDGDEFPVASLLRDRTDHYLGGIRLERRRMHLSLEQGGSTFSNDQQIGDAARNTGNVSVPLFGQTLFLSSLAQAYNVAGDSVYSKAIFTANPARWVNIWAQGMYSRPRTDVQYAQSSAGNLYLYNLLSFYNSEQAALSSQASMPHSTAVVNAEFRPVRRLRLTESWFTDRLHNASAAYLTDQYLAGKSAADIRQIVSSDRLESNYSQQELDLFFDLFPNLTLRAGHRYIWGDVRDRAPQLSITGPLETGELRRQVALAGLTYQAGKRLSVHADFEEAPGGRTYFRTGLEDYRRVKVQARYQAFASLRLHANFSVLDNRNPATDGGYHVLARQNAISATWTPAGGKHITVLSEYERYTLQSELAYRIPTERTAMTTSAYRDKGHSGSLSLVVPVAGSGALRPRLRAGASFFVSSGSRPARYYQPIGGLSLPINKYLECGAEWRWYGFNQPLYLYEGFRVHQLLTTLRLTM